jgi:hypothetical protein
MKVFFTSKQNHGRNKPYQAKDMVAMKVGNENVINFRKSDFEFSHLRLSSFAAIDQKKPPKYIEYLGGWISV